MAGRVWRRSLEKDGLCKRSRNGPNGCWMFTLQKIITFFPHPVSFSFFFFSFVQLMSLASFSLSDFFCLPACQST